MEKASPGSMTERMEHTGNGTGKRPSPSVSLILITYNRYDEINRTLATLRCQDGDFELVVVDNGSTAEGKIDLEGWRNVRFKRLNANGDRRADGTPASAWQREISWFSSMMMPLLPIRKPCRESGNGFGRIRPWES